MANFLEMAGMAEMAQQMGNYEQSVELYTSALQCIPPNMPHDFFVRLLRDRAEVNWQLLRYEDACSDIDTALKIDPMLALGCELACDVQANRWIDRGDEMTNAGNVDAAIHCFSIVLNFSKKSRKVITTASALVRRATMYYRKGDISFARKDINSCRKIHPELAKGQGAASIKIGDVLFGKKKYAEALDLYKLALEFCTADMDAVCFEAHNCIASCYFCLKNYDKALIAGKEAVKVKQCKSASEAKKWKERGKELFKANKYSLLDEYYSLALSYAHHSDKELVSQLLCNRSLAFLKKNFLKSALTDAKECVKTRPSWSKGHYRLGSCLAQSDQGVEAMIAFSAAYDLCEAEEEKYDVFDQMLALSAKAGVPSGIKLEEIHCKKFTKRATNEAVKKNDFAKLWALFLGGIEGHGLGDSGLAMLYECDTASCDLGKIVAAKVPGDLPTLISALADHGALVDGTPGCQKPPILCAMEEKEFKLASELIRRNADLGCLYGKQNLISEDRAVFLFKEAEKMLNPNYISTNQVLPVYYACIELCPTWLKNLQGACQDSISGAYFLEKDYAKCIDAGMKSYSLHPHPSERNALEWRERGNIIFKEKEMQENKDNLLIRYYSLAINYSPESCSEMRGALLSNRCLIYLNMYQYDEALADAKKCVASRPGWFKAYYRLSCCLKALGKTTEALKAACDGYRKADCNEDKVCMATQVIASATEAKGGTMSVTCKISDPVMQRIIKDICNKKEWDKLKLLFLGGDPNRNFPQGRGGLATGTDASHIPLDSVLRSDMSNLSKLVAVLIDHGADVNGMRGSKNRPLCLALAQEKYSIVAQLLKHKADPSCIGAKLPDKPANKECQFQHWKDLATKAMNAKDYSRAIQLLNIALQFTSSSSKDANHKLHTLFATAYFELKMYEKALENGNECFKLKPVKDQAEAYKWKDRGKELFRDKRYVLLVEFYTLAIKYVPSNEKELLATLLGNRALAHYNMSNYQQGLDDAKSCSRFRPEWYKGYARQGYCYSCLNQHKEALRAFSEALNRAANPEDQFTIFNQILACAALLPDGISSLTCNLPEAVVKRAVKDACATQDWAKLDMLYLGGGGSKRCRKGEGGFATGMSAADIPIEHIVQSTYMRKAQLITTLLENGAKADGLNQTAKPPLAIAFDNEEFGIVVSLLQYNASASLILDGATGPLQIAFNMAVKKGKFHFLKALLDAEGIDVDAKDRTGNTVLHQACLAQSSKRKCDAIQAILDGGANPAIKNNEGKQPLDLIMAKKDPRVKLIRAAVNALKSGNKKPRKRNRQVKQVELRDNNSVPTDGSTKTASLSPSEGTSEGDADQEPNKASASHYTQKKTTGSSSTEALREDISYMLEAVTPAELDVPTDNEDEIGDEKAPIAADGLEVVTASEAEGLEENGQDTYEEEEDEEAEEELSGVPESNLLSAFENLPWEVDCTDVFWKVLQSNEIALDTKRMIISKICMLAQGRWTKKLCRRIDGSPREQGMFLFKARAAKAAWIIWELSVAFSARCSDDREMRGQDGTHSGRVYTEIIRVWDVATDYRSIDGKVERIVKSHNRGLNCMVKKELQGFKKSLYKPVGEGERLPNFFTEVSESVDELVGERSGTCSSMKLFVPPASPNDQEYHILKFYAFSSALVNSVLQMAITGRMDFPFRVTELEHRIINLRPNPPRSVILLGRSGTGKTTCCLYRLWNEFRSYWEKAVSAGPHIPKMLEFIQKENGSAAVSNEEEMKEEETHDEKPEENPEVPEVNEEDFIRAADARRRGEDGDTEELDGEEKYEHLHQVFVTKNAVLCTEVRKNFKELTRACSAAQEHVQGEDNPLPYRITDMEETAWPLFVNSRTLLLMLDASLDGKEFFPRAEDGSLVRKITGWGEGEAHMNAIIEEVDSDTEDEEQGNLPEEQNDNARGRANFDPRREVTYGVFANELWTKICKGNKVVFHPTLLWMEIRSFIKGSVEALHSEKGYLTLEEYHSIGRKRAPNFPADRSEVYALFRVYQRMKSTLGMFDEADIVHNLFTRLQQVGPPDWSIHRIYVDETQDFTQAELSLLIRCSRDPNGLFFTGDTAQSIMRGIAFRFSDLKSLFYYAQQSYHSVGIQSGVRVPDQLYQLTHNYRSHVGILKLASCVVDLLVYFFPDSFDRLRKDQGLFDGPKPVLLESCSFSDLAMILQGNKRRSSRIEFGAHQVILVASDESRQSMPDELKHGLVMTIYEAKGLEFDDVLIYNFFKDSQARKEWRVVSSFVKSLEEGKATCSSGLAVLTDDDLATTSRPLTFDEVKHKVLNSEFKYLYTAITRARVNVWFFDEDEEARAPMFEYFQKLGLVRVVQISEESDTLSSMFVEQSTEAEWQKRGKDFFSRGMWEVAIKCFTFSQDEGMIRKSQAHLQAAEAHKLRTNPKAMQVEYLKAAHQFLKCRMVPEAAVCLRNAKERVLLARLHRNIGRYEEAAKLFAREQMYLAASECYETISDYFNAVEVLCRGSLYKDAIDAVERYNSLAGRDGVVTGIRPPKVSRTVERLCHQLAEEHFRIGKPDDMVAVLNRLPSVDDKIAFLQRHGCVQETIEALLEESRFDEAAKVLKTNGRFSEAAKYSTDPHVLADCHLSRARAACAHNTIEDAVEPLEEALRLFIKVKDKIGEAEARMLLGKCKRSSDDLDQARRLFYNSNHAVGEFSACVMLYRVSGMDLPQSVPFRHILDALEHVLSLVLTMSKQSSMYTNAEQRTVMLCEGFYGLEPAESSSQRCIYPKSGSRFASIALMKDDIRHVIDVKQAYKLIADTLLLQAAEFTNQLKTCLKRHVRENLQCKMYNVGIPCHESCMYQHNKITPEQFRVLFEGRINELLLNAVAGKFIHAAPKQAQQQFTNRVSIAKEIASFRDCHALYDLFFPNVGHQGVFVTREIMRQVRRNRLVCERLEAFAEAVWKADQRSTKVPHLDSDVFIQITRVLYLTGASKKLLLWLSIDEKVNPRSDAMLNDKRSGRSRSFLSVFHDGLRLLHSYGDVLNSSHSILRRYLTFIAKKTTLPVPSIINTVSIIEQQLVVCLALYARLSIDYNYHVCLPESYLQAINIYDMVNCSDKAQGSIYQAVEATAMQSRTNFIISSVHSLLLYMVQLVCGVIGKHFNIIRDAFVFRHGDEIVSGEVERTLVLALTMLCNCGFGIPFNCSAFLLDNLRSLSMQITFPSRIRQALQAVQTASHIPDVVAALEAFLQSRSERLYCLRWNQHSLHFSKQVGASLFSQMRPSQLFAFGNAGQVEAVEAHASHEDPPEFQMPQRYLEQQQRERQEVEVEMAAIKIQKWYRRIKCAQQQAQVPFTAPPTLQVDELMYQSTVLHFDKFKADASECSVCRVRFSLQTGDGYVTSEVAMPTFEEHVSEGSPHHQRVAEFEKYREWHMKRVLPLFVQDTKLREKIENAEGRTSGGPSGHNFGLDSQRLSCARGYVSQAIQEFESAGQWRNLKDLEPLIKTFEDTIQTIEVVLLQDVVNKGGPAEADEAEQGEDWDEEEPEELAPSGVRRGRSGRRQRKRGGNRKKGRNEEKRK
ncbi:TPR and ankyrin repeat-containing protein 1 isoform X2 [Nematostella vectensis]|nr:TPR and ankyrin repeat-containing protein 1 isoform X2 [Nematostella vectensis]